MNINQFLGAVKPGYAEAKAKEAAYRREHGPSTQPTNEGLTDEQVKAGYKTSTETGKPVPPLGRKVSLLTFAALGVGAYFIFKG